MTFTLIGVVVAILGSLILLTTGVARMLGFVMAVTLFGGSAAIALPALGGSTIPPASLSIGFLILRAIMPGPQQMQMVGAAIQRNLWLILFGLYGIISAFIMPHLFAGAVNLTPLRPGAVRQLYEVAPVGFSPQNITTAFYLLGTMAAGIGTYIGARRPEGARIVVTLAVWIACIHTLFGFLSIAVAGTSLDIVIEFFRNGRYAQLDQSIAGLSRMNGVWPEASGYAAYGGAWLIFMTELWIRDVRARATGLAALALASALLISTSSTAYVTLGGYSAVLALRIILLPGTIPAAKLIGLIGTLLICIIIALALILLSPDIAEAFARIVTIMTVDKADSYSGLQRLFWAQQGIDAFVATGGLGVGAGSFRSSSLITAILGSMGLIGIVAFVGHLMMAWKPWSATTWTMPRSEAEAIGAAAGWTCVLMLMPAAISSPTPDPGVVWAILAGIAIALRSPQSTPLSHARTNLPSQGRAS